MLPLLFGLAFGQEDETITVYGQAEVKEAREEVARALEEEGYVHKNTRRGKDVFVADAPWKPKVLLDRDGYAIIRRRGVVWTGPEGGTHTDRNKLEYAWCVLYPPACISTRGLQVSRRKLDGERRRVVQAMDPALRRYRDAVTERALSERLAVELPAELAAIWYDDARDPVERRDAIVALAASRTWDPPGMRARELVVAWLGEHVQDTEWAVPDDVLIALVTPPDDYVPPLPAPEEPPEPGAPAAWGSQPAEPFPVAPKGLPWEVPEVEPE